MTARATSSTSSTASVRASRRSRPSRRSPPPAGRRGGAERQGPRRSRMRRWAARRAAAPHRRLARPSPRPRRRCPASRSARSRTASTRLVEHPQDGDSARARSGSARSARVPSSAARVSLSARRARWRGCRRSRSTSSARPATTPACGPPSSLSPGEDELGACGDAGGGGRLVTKVEEEPEPRPLDERQPSALRDPGQLSCWNRRGETDDPVVRPMDPQRAAVSGPIAYL